MKGTAFLFFQRRRRMVSYRAVKYVILGLLAWTLAWALVNQIWHRNESQLVSSVGRLYPLVIWNSDFRVSPIRDLKQLLIPQFGVKIIDKSMSSSCSLVTTCQTDLKVLSRENSESLEPSTVEQFYDHYKNDAELNTVNVFLCIHPVSLCELYARFNRSLIVIATTRYEFGRRDSPERWIELNENLKRWSQDSRNTIAANNRYDAEYIRYFTGLEAIVLPSYCDYTRARYQPVAKKKFLIGKMHGGEVFQTFFKSSLRESIQRANASIEFAEIREIYPDGYQYTQLAEHPAMIYVPYQVSLMSVFEQYRMGLPLFFPSIQLLVHWQIKYRVVDEINWNNSPRNQTPINGTLMSTRPDPNKQFDKQSLEYWLNFADFYQFPHIQYFDSFDVLVQKLIKTDFVAVSKRMHVYSSQVKERLMKNWDDILRRASVK